MDIIKRDGSLAKFDKTKIEVAIKKAMKNGSGVYIPELSKKIASEIESVISQRDTTPTIYDVEELVYDKLIEYGESYTAKVYEGYRAVQAFKRDNDPLIKSILDLVQRTNEEVMSENSNKDANLVNTQRDLMAGEISKFIARNYMIPPHLTQAEDIGAIKIHDKDYYANAMHNCDVLNIEDMLQNGTVINKKMIRKPNSLRTAMTIVTQIAASVASSQYGGQSMSLAHIAPFVRISEDNIRAELIEDFPVLSIKRREELVLKRLKKEIKDSVQLFNYQINTISSSNGQTPFNTIGIYLNANPEYTRETALLAEEFFKQRIEGMENEFGVKISQTFPKILYFLDENNIHEDSEYFYLTKLAAQSIAKRLSPDLISVKKMKEYYGAAYECMGCRSFISDVVMEDGSLDIYGRGNVGVCTVSLPHAALTAGKDIEKFFEVLEQRLDLCKEVGVMRYEKFGNTPAKVAPILWQHGAIARLQPDEPIMKALKERRFTVSIGYIGLHETVKYLTGETLTSPKGIELGKRIMKFLHDYKERAKKETGYLFGIYGTPSESTAGTLSEKLREQFGEIEGITDKGYLINSYHIDIKEEVNAFDKLTIEQEFAQYSLGGTITYVELPNMEKNIEAVIQLMQHMYDTNIYAEMNVESDTCSSCGYSGTMSIGDDMVWYCPQCGENDKDKISVVRRTCGYISDNNWGYSRLLDIINRVKHL